MLVEYWLLLSVFALLAVISIAIPWLALKRTNGVNPGQFVELVENYLNIGQQLQISLQRQIDEIQDNRQQPCLRFLQGIEALSAQITTYSPALEIYHQQKNQGRLQTQTDPVSKNFTLNANDFFADALAFWVTQSQLSTEVPDIKLYRIFRGKQKAYWQQINHYLRGITETLVHHTQDGMIAKKKLLSIFNEQIQALESIPGFTNGAAQQVMETAKFFSNQHFDDQSRKLLNIIKNNDQNLIDFSGILHAVRRKEAGSQKALWKQMRHFSQRIQLQLDEQIKAYQTCLNQVQKTDQENLLVNKHQVLQKVKIQLRQLAFRLNQFDKRFRRYKAMNRDYPLWQEQIEQEMATLASELLAAESKPESSESAS